MEVGLERPLPVVRLFQVESTHTGSLLSVETPSPLIADHADFLCLGLAHRCVTCDEGMCKVMSWLAPGPQWCIPGTQPTELPML